MTERRDLLHSFFRKAKKTYYTLVNGGINGANRIVGASYGIRNRAIGEVVRSAARAWGAYATFLMNFPRYDVTKVSGEAGTIVYVGVADLYRVALMSTLLPEGYEEEALGREAAWRLPARTQEWLDTADLIVWRVSRKHPWRMPTAYTLENPLHIQLVLDLDKPPEALLEGGGRVKSRLRQKVRKMQVSFTSRLSQSMDDFEHFYHRMYLPTLQKRFGDLAERLPYEVLKGWMERGCLIQIVQGDQVIAAALNYVQNDVCFAGAIGYLDGEASWIEQGASIAVYWYTIEWAYQQGLARLDFIGANAWESNGVFHAKQQWGPRLGAFPYEHTKLVMGADRLSAVWQDRLNAMGFLTCVNGKYLRAYFENPAQPYGQAEIETLRTRATKRGLGGVQLIGPGTRRNFF